MHERRPVLTSQDHRNAKPWIKCLLEGYREGNLSLDDVDAEIGHVLQALDIGNEGEVRNAFGGTKDLMSHLPKL